MADKDNDITVKLLAGQQKLEKDVVDLKKDVSGLKTDVVDLKKDVSGLKTDVADLKKGQHRLETGFAEVKESQQKLETGFVELKERQQSLETGFVELKEGQNRVEKFLLNLENIIVPKINAMYESSISNREQIKRVDEAEIKNAQKLENHELRITRLEQSR